MACVCCAGLGLRCKVCSTKTCVVGGTWSKIVTDQYFERAEGNIENLPEGPISLGYAGSSRLKALWKWPRASSINIPQIFLPSFTWQAGFPNNLDGCLYVSLESTTAQLYGEGCCGIDFGNVVCGSRSNVIAYEGKYRWRMMVLDCESESFQDVTGSAVTQIQPFEGEYNQLTTHPNRFCATIKSTAMPDYFPSEVPVVCS
jgi:hypothetical protein